MDHRSRIHGYPASPGTINSLSTDGIKSLDIRTKTIEVTLMPMLQQITNLVNRRLSAASPSDIEHVTLNVETAIKQFISAGEKVAGEHANIREPMLEACKQARKACGQITEKVDKKSTPELVQSVRHLLATMYKVLVLADSVIVSDIMLARDKVIQKLDRLTQVDNFTDFLNSFSSLGAQMAEFGKSTGERQMDMKRELDAAKMACLRGFLEKSTAIYLTACKICLRHPTSTLSCQCRDTIVSLMKNGLNEIMDIICYAPSAATDDHTKILSKALQQYMDSLEMCAILSNDATSLTCTVELFSAVEEYVNEFTDSPYTPHEHREIIVLMCEKCKQDVQHLADQSQIQNGGDLPPLMETAIENCRYSILNLKKQLIQHTVSSAAELFGSSIDTGLLAALKTAAQQGEAEKVENISSQVRDHVDQIQEMSKQLQHVSPTDSFYVRVKYTASYLLSLTELLLSSAEVFCCHPMSKVAAEGYSTMADSWVMLIGELAAASEELHDSMYHRT